MQINYWEQSGKEEIHVQTPACAFFFSSFMQALKQAHSGRRTVYTVGKSHMEVCGCVCVCMCWGDISHEKNPQL